MVIKLPRPHPKQQLFLRSKAKKTGYGGARGGGKSWVARVKALKLALKYPGIKILIVRRTYPELRNNHILPMQQLVPTSVAKYVDVHKELQFVNGSVIMFGYCESEKDMPRYQGLEVDVLFLEEATQFSEDVFKMFDACVRGTNHFPKRMYLTFNPGGKGHVWVKRLFIDRAYNTGENPDDYVFIQALVTDNEALMRMQPEYIRQLEALPPKLRAAWLHGRWDIFEGQFFEEFRNAPERRDRRGTHVIKAFDPPASWPRFRSYDFGYSKPFSVGWWAQDHDGRLYRILELYGCTETPNEGVKWDVDRQFAEIARIEREHPYLKGMQITGVADPAIWGDGKGGKSTADVAAEHGVYFQKGNHDRINGWMQVHYRLTFGDDGRPMMYVFDNCKAFIRTIPLLCYDDHIKEDIDTDGEDHVADETRYLCMLSPVPPPEKKQERKWDYDPLDRELLDGVDDGMEFFRI